MSTPSVAGRPSRSIPRDVRAAALGRRRRARARPDHLPGLDGLRAFAVTAVVLYHLGHLDGGFVGVDLFFVLSGFLISRLLLAERESSGGVSLRGFWSRRIRRLLPALLVTVVGVMVAARQILPDWRLGRVRDDSLAAIAYVSNWRQILSGQSYFAPDPSPLRHAWSLAIEEQFYLVWPLMALAVFFLVGRRRRRGFAFMCLGVGVASASWSAVAAGRGFDIDRLYYGTDTRIFAMALGGFVASFFDPVRNRFRDPSSGRVTGTVAPVLAGALGLVGLVAAAFVADNTAPGMYRGGLVVIASLAALTVFGIGWGTPALRWVGASPLRWIGDRSYGIYLHSWPIQVFLQNRFPEWGRPLLTTTTILSTLVTSQISYVLVERPIVRGRWPLQVREPTGNAGRRPAPGARVRPAAMGAAIVLTTVAVVALGLGARPEPDFMAVDDDTASAVALEEGGFGDPSGSRPNPAPSASTTTAPSPSPSPDDGPDDVAPLDPGPAPPFDPGSPMVVTASDRDPSSIHGRPLRLTVIGDSVAWSLTFGVEPELEVPIELSGRAIIGCGAIPGDHEWYLDGWQPYREACLTEQPEAERLGLAAGPDAVLLWFGAWEVFDQRSPDGTVMKLGEAAHDVLVRDGIQRRVDAARAAGVPVVMALTPCFGSSRAAPHAVVRTRHERVERVNAQIRAVAEHNPGWVRLIDPAEVLCRGTDAVTEADGIVLRPEGTHFENDSAGWLWNEYLASTVAEALAGEDSGTGR